MINKLYYEKVVKVYKITPKQYENALMGRSSSGSGFWGRVGGGVPWFLWGGVIGTLIVYYIFFKIIYWVMSTFYSAAFGCAIDNPIIVAFLTLGITVWLIHIFIYGPDIDTK